MNPTPEPYIRPFFFQQRLQIEPLSKSRPIKDPKMPRIWKLGNSEPLILETWKKKIACNITLKASLGCISKGTFENSMKNTTWNFPIPVKKHN